MLNIDPTTTDQSSRLIAASLSLSAKPTLGLDLDGCIDEFPVFFQVLSLVWPGNVIVVTFRDDRAKAIADLAKFQIRHDEVVLVSSLAQKAKILVERGVLVYFDDQPEVLQHVPETINVLLVRNGGNFDFADSRWVMSAQTAKLLA